MLKSKEKAKSKTKSSSKQDTYHHGDLKSVLIKAALKLLKTKSIDELSLRELAREAGVSQAAPYRHFKDKEALLAEISKEGFELKSRYMSEAIENAGNNMEDVFYACGLAYFRMGYKNPEHFNLMCRKGIMPDQSHPELMRAAATSFAILCNMISRCQNEGLIGAGDPFHISLNCWAAVHGFTSLYSEGRLEWLGVTKENAEGALKALMCQFINGGKNKIELSVFGFKPFETEHSKIYLENLKFLVNELQK